jgi:hypothetical protein
LAPQWLSLMSPAKVWSAANAAAVNPNVRTTAAQSDFIMTSLD